MAGHKLGAGGMGRMPSNIRDLMDQLLSSLELRDTQVYEPQLRALLARFGEVVVLKLRHGRRDFGPVAGHKLGAGGMGRMSSNIRDLMDHFEQMLSVRSYTDT